MAQTLIVTYHVVVGLVLGVAIMLFTMATQGGMPHPFQLWASPDWTLIPSAAFGAFCALLYWAGASGRADRWWGD